MPINRICFQMALTKKALQAQDSLNKPLNKRLSNNDLLAPLGAVSESEADDDVFEVGGGTTVGRKRLSLYGVALTLRAFKITRRLSVSQYMTSELNTSGRLFSKSTSRKNSVYQPITKYENTYIMKEKEDQSFPTNQVRRIISNVLSTNLSDQTYRGREVSSMVKFISSSIIGRVKLINIPRYKIVCNVILGQNNGQGCLMATRCMLDESIDSYACETFKNNSLFAIGIVHAMYYEWQYHYVCAMYHGHLYRWRWFVRTQIEANLKQTYKQ